MRGALSLHGMQKLEREWGIIILIIIGSDIIMKWFILILFICFENYWYIDMGRVYSYLWYKIYFTEEFCFWQLMVIIDKVSRFYWWRMRVMVETSILLGNIFILGYSYNKTKGWREQISRQKTTLTSNLWWIAKVDRESTKWRSFSQGVEVVRWHSKYQIPSQTILSNPIII